MDYSIWQVSAHCNYYPYLFSILCFNWWKITLQFCVGFCYTMTWESHAYTHTHTHTHTHIPFHLSLPLLPQLHPSRSLQSTKVGSLCYLANSHCFTYDSVYMSMLLKGVAMSHERCRDSWPLEERISFQGQWWGLIAESLCVINFY